jgi:hypothetical protein
MIATRVLMAAAPLALSLLAGGCGIGNAQTRLRTAIDASKPGLDQCYGSALERDRDAAGDMLLLVHVEEKTGRVAQVKVAKTAIQDAGLHQCVQSALEGVTLDPKPKANLKVEYTLRFAPTS